MHCGYLYKRNVPISPPSMQKVYSVLWGTFLLDYDTEEVRHRHTYPPLYWHCPRLLVRACMRRVCAA